MKAWASEQVRSFRGHKDVGREPKASHPSSFESCRLSACHWRSARQCPNVID
jgi:hypothetical protein